MSDDELLICHQAFRDLFIGWSNGDISFDEAVFLAHRVEFHLKVDWLPARLISVALGVYDRLHEP